MNDAGLDVLTRADSPPVSVDLDPEADKCGLEILVNVLVGGKKHRIPKEEAERFDLPILPDTEVVSDEVPADPPTVLEELGRIQADLATGSSDAAVPTSAQAPLADSPATALPKPTAYNPEVPKPQREVFVMEPGPVPLRPSERLAEAAVEAGAPPEAKGKEPSGGGAGGPEKVPSATPPKKPNRFDHLSRLFERMGESRFVKWLKRRDWFYWRNWVAVILMIVLLIKGNDLMSPRVQQFLNINGASFEEVLNQFGAQLMELTQGQHRLSDDLLNQRGSIEEQNVRIEALRSAPPQVQQPALAGPPPTKLMEQLRQMRGISASTKANLDLLEKKK